MSAGNWILEVFSPLPEDEAAWLRDYFGDDGSGALEDTAMSDQISDKRIHELEREQLMAQGVINGLREEHQKLLDLLSDRTEVIDGLQRERTELIKILRWARSEVREAAKYSAAYRKLCELLAQLDNHHEATFTPADKTT